MPIYTYQCECGVQFEELTAMGTETVECIACGRGAKMALPEGLNFSLQAPTQGIAPQNTGFSGIDAEVDRVIAQDSVEKWAAIDQRDAYKREILASNPGTDKTDLSKMPDGDYKVMEPWQKKAALTGRTINNLVMYSRRKALEAAKAAKK